MNDDSYWSYLIKNCNILSLDILNTSKSFQNGTCIAFGKIFKIPMIIKIEKPNPEPKDKDDSLYDKWIVNS